MLEHLNKLHLNIKNRSSLQQALSSTAKYSMIVSPFEDGVIFEDKVLFVTETDLFPEHITKSKVSEYDHHPTVDLKDLAELKVGMHIVHINYGIGRYEGLEAIELNNKKD